MATTVAIVFSVRPILYFERQCIIVLQSVNGACPLIALINILSLRGVVDLFSVINRQNRTITADALSNTLANYMMERFNNSRHRGDANTEVNLNDAFEQLPRFLTGMDINPKFTSIDDYEASREVAVVDACGVRMVHGWIPDPQNTTVVQELIPNASYNVMIGAVMEGKATNVGTWFEQNATQLSMYGLFELQAHVAEGELCMLFRNNHYSVLTKRKGCLYTLLTDEGFASSRNTVWQSLVDTDNSASVNVGFTFGEKPATPPPGQQLSGPPPHQYAPAPGAIYQAQPVYESMQGQGQQRYVRAKPVNRKKKDDDDCCTML